MSLCCCIICEKAYTEAENRHYYSLIVRTSYRHDNSSEQVIEVDNLSGQLIEVDNSSGRYVDNNGGSRLPYTPARLPVTGCGQLAVDWV